VLGRALEIHPDIKLDRKPRMADFYRWGCAIAEALGKPKEKFMDAYDANIANQNDEAIEASPVALAVIRLMQYQDSWEGTATDLLGALNDVSDAALHAKAAGLPPHPNWLSRNLTLLQPNLLAHGIVMERKDTARPRKIIITKNANFTVDTDELSGLSVIEDTFGAIDILTDAEIPFDDRQYDSTDSKNSKTSDE
ncbi:MAG: hypothetical protein ACRD4B_01985, partial [Acidobacteriota bacterium]